MLIESFDNTIDVWIKTIQHHRFEDLCKQSNENNWSIEQVCVHLINDTNWFLEQIKIAY